MAFFDKDFREIFSSEAISLTGGLVAGIALAAYTDKLLLIPGMLIALPGFLEMRGNITGSLASRLSSGLFLGVVKKEKSRIVHGNITGSMALTLATSLTLGLLAFLFIYITIGTLYYPVILMFIFAGVFADLIEIPLTIILTFYLFHKGHDPNNIFGPLLTSLGDVSSIVALLIAVMVI